MLSSSWSRPWEARPRKVPGQSCGRRSSRTRRRRRSRSSGCGRCSSRSAKRPEEVECKGIRGLIEEHDHFKEEEDPADDIMDIFNIGAAEKVESYEICAYEGLIRLAD